MRPFESISPLDRRELGRELVVVRVHVAGLEPLAQVPIHLGDHMNSPVVEVAQPTGSSRYGFGSGHERSAATANGKGVGNTVLGKVIVTPTGASVPNAP
jgi:hypothetical protein